jgi:hypothetical protein
MAEFPTPRQLAIVRHCRAALKRIFLERPGCRADDDTLAEIQELCLGSMRALDDAVCGGRLVTIHCCAAALYSDKAHRHWDRGATCGADVLRRKIFRALNALQRRLYALERRAARAGLESNQRPRDHEALEVTFSKRRELPTT